MRAVARQNGRGFSGGIPATGRKGLNLKLDLRPEPIYSIDEADTWTKEAIIGAHCSCPTRLGGFSAPPEPYDITHHHANRDATARTLWKEGQRVTCTDVLDDPGFHQLFFYGDFKRELVQFCQLAGLEAVVV